jgi:tRNA G10  N-methylase Trm11
MGAVDDILDFGSDLALRYRFFSRASLAHPAKLHLGLLLWLVERYTQPGDTIIDPMAGVGSVALAALSQRNVILREIESRWLALAHENAALIIRAAGMFAGAINVGQADVCEPWNVCVDCVLFSPPYGCDTSPNRFRVKGILSHKQRLLAERPGILGQRWQLLLGREQTQPGSAGSIQFHYGDHAAQIGHFRGASYWSEMARIYTHAHAALRPDGLMILIIKDHIRKGQRVCVADETAALCERLGFTFVARHQRRVYPLSLWQRRRKEQGKPVIEEEDVLVLRRVL